MDRPFKTLTYAEMQDSRAKGLCMFCDEQYTPGHHLKHNKAQVHLMEGNDDESDKDCADQGDNNEISNVTALQISIHALTGVSMFNTMRVTGYVKDKPIHILIDSGSTHNFLDSKIA